MENNLRLYLIEECYAMIKHISAYGKKLPPESTIILDYSKEQSFNSDVSDTDILKLHRSLSKQIAPARPETIRLLCKESQKSKWLNFLGPVGLVRRMMFTALCSLFLFIALSLSEEINFVNIKRGIYDLHGQKLLIVMCFLLTSASLGAAFSNLFQANQFIIKNIYNPKYESSYWIRYVLGIIAGIMLAFLIPVPDVDTAEAGQAHLAVASRPMLAMLGGFSASLVYRILFRMVYAVESIFIGKQSEESERKLAQQKAANEVERENEKQQFLGYLMKIQSEINKGTSNQDLSNSLQMIIAEAQD